MREGLQRLSRQREPRLLLQLPGGTSAGLLEVVVALIGNLDLATGKYSEPGHVCELIAALEEERLQSAMSPSDHDGRCRRQRRAGLIRKLKHHQR